MAPTPTVQRRRQAAALQVERALPSGPPEWASGEERTNRSLTQLQKSLRAHRRRSPVSLFQSTIASQSDPRYFIGCPADTPQREARNEKPSEPTSQQAPAIEHSGSGLRTHT